MKGRECTCTVGGFGAGLVDFDFFCKIFVETLGQRSCIYLHNAHEDTVLCGAQIAY